MLLLVGLGNPGAKYEKNRHNIGFMAIDEIASSHSFGPERTRFQSITREGTIQTDKGVVKALLMKPQTFMNNSGHAVSEAAKFYKVDPKDIIVFHDELDLAPGRFRMKLGGGHAGHNGLRSIMAQCGPNFRRARMGIGHPGDKSMVHPYVLADFAKSEMVWVDDQVRACAKALSLVVIGEDDKYQNEVMRLAPAPKFSPRQAAEAAKAGDTGL